MIVNNNSREKRRIIKEYKNTEQQVLNELVKTVVNKQGRKRFFLFPATNKIKAKVSQPPNRVPRRNITIYRIYIQFE
jgi:hypothetical protein